MRFENAFDVAGSPAQVIEKFADLPLMATFLPGASIGPANPDGSHPGTLVVSFGPKRLAFKGTIVNRVDRAGLRGVMSGKASADVRGARMAVTMTYSLGESQQRPAGTRVMLDSEAELTGVLAEFAKTGGVVVTSAVLAEFARRFSAQFEAPMAVPAAAAADPQQALSALALAGQVARAALRSIGRAVANAWQALLPRRG